MELSKIFELSYDAIFVTLKISLPILLVALFVGLIVSLMQALTQIQEATLSFVPKILAVFAVLILTMGYIGSTMQQYVDQIMIEITNLD